MPCEHLISSTVLAAAIWGAIGCGASDTEVWSAEEQGRLSSGGSPAGDQMGSSGGMRTGAGGAPQCSLPHVCERFSTTDLSGNPCSCLERQICAGVLRNDVPPISHTYFCRPN
jgi:hypothetical protein